jgi:hypothetical protein
MHRTDWTSYEDFGELLAAACNEPPASATHGLLVEDDVAGGSWAWAWFATAQERLGWIVRVKQLEPVCDRLSDADIRVLEEIGSGPSTGPGLEINGGTVSWMGRFEDLLEGNDEVARRWRARFWGGLDAQEVAYAIPSDPQSPIPPDAHEDFLRSIQPT